VTPVSTPAQTRKPTTATINAITQNSDIPFLILALRTGRDTANFSINVLFRHYRLLHRSDSQAYTWIVETRHAPELVTIRQFGNMSEALMAKGCLESAGIECFLADANITRLEWPLSRGMRLQVSPDDVEAAIAFLVSPTGDSSI